MGATATRPRISDLRKTLSEVRDELSEVQDELSDTEGHVTGLMMAARIEHAEYGHVDHFRWCTRPVCALVRSFDGQYGT